VKLRSRAQGRTLAEVAKAAGISPSSLYQVTAGKVRAWPALRQCIASELGSTEEELFGVDVVDRLVESRKEQGLGLTVESEAVLRQVVSLLATHLSETTR
jgi:transcriptional regulator with XRE-family HTH domain